MASTPPDTPTADAPPPMDEHDALPAGTRFGELEVLRVLGVGGFGIVYLAQDHALERQVALKEYMPSSLAGRGKGLMVSIRSGAHTETYALGLRSFVNEARLLARFNHPSLVKVYRFWEENGTAYMVMPYLQGRTLRDVRRSMSGPPSEAWMRSVIGPVLDALEQLHREDVFHRDIAPDNILLPPGELPVLLDFGAARRAIGDRTQTFTAILKPSYAPIEQYAEAVQLRQGPWTDLYALGAVAYYLLRGTPPPPATARAVQEDLPLLAAGDFPGISAHFVAAVEWALAVRPAHRPQNIAALREVLDGRASVPPRVHTGTTAPPVNLVPPEAPTFAPTLQMERPASPPTAIEPTRPMTAPPSRTPPPRTAPPTRRTGTDAPPPKEHVRVGWLVAGFAGLVAVAATAAWLIGRTPVPALAPAVVHEAAPQPTATPPAPAAAPEVATVAASATPAPVARLPASAARPPVAARADKVPHRSEPAVREPVQVAETPAKPDDGTARGPAVGVTANTPATSEPGTPRQACGARVFLALALCMEQQCERPRFKGHPQCRKVVEMLERRRRGESGGSD
ncbi:MAG TPA: protein kinase [Albitalea sp.]|uniref:serine/threonine protein kinase n=1 Tax=Piscinibacter sp. TaxID=1903157 RepID=UPI002ED1F1F3